MTSADHEYIGASFWCRGDEHFVVMLRDRAIMWIARAPKELRLDQLSLVDAQGIERWFMSYTGPQLSPEEVATSCQRGLDWEASREVNPLIDTLARIGPDTEGRKHERVARAMDRLNPWALTIGMSAEQLQEVVPRPVKVETREGGAVDYTYGEDFNGGWYGAPQMVVTVREGRVENVLSVYLVSEYMRKYTRPIEQGK